MKYDVLVDIDLEDLIPGFIENRKKDIVELQKALSIKDYNRIHDIGHSLKGVGSGYGFVEVTNIGSAIELIAKNEVDYEIMELVLQLEEYMNHVNIVYVDEDGGTIKCQ